MNLPSPVTLQIECDSLQQTELLARRLAIHLPAGSCLCLNGDLGAGKTCFVRAFAATLGVDPQQVNSPTYVILQHYWGDVLIHHFDLYRLKDENELYETGADDFFESQGISLIEWSDKFPELMPTDRLEVKLTVTGPSSRSISMKAFTLQMVDVLQNLEESYSQP